MDELTFHLEGVVKNRREEPEDFTGPLELVLMLLSKNKIEIRDIRISELLDQYLAYLARMRELDLDIASGFVQMAAHLMFIKTRMLLAGDKEVTEMELLVSTLEQLKCRDAYASVMAVLPALSEPLERGLRFHTRAQEPLPDRGAAYEVALQPMELLAALAPLLLRSAGRPDPKEIMLHAAPPPVVYGVREKSRQLLALLRERGAMTLGGLYALCAGRSEVVATFLSVLELCTAGSLRVIRDDGSFRVSCSEVLP